MDGATTTRLSLLELLRTDASDEAAWGEFVRIYGPAIMRWCRVRGLQHDDALDVTQDVLVRFWRAAKQFHYDPRGRFRSYLEQVARSALVRWAEQRRAHPRVADQTLLAEAPAREDLLARLAEAHDAERLAIAMETVERRVKPHTWQAFRLLAVENRSGAEVAAALDMEANAAYVARWKVQRMIRETFDRLGRSNDPASSPSERAGPPSPPVDARTRGRATKAPA